MIGEAVSKLQIDCDQNVILDSKFTQVDDEQMGQYYIYIYTGTDDENIYQRVQSHSLSRYEQGDNGFSGTLRGIK